MKLIYSIALWLASALLPVMILWGTLFYYAMAGEINDEADDSLDDYAALIINRCQEGRPLPSLNNGSNNSYTITPVDDAEVAEYRGPRYYDREVYIPEKGETEPARVLSRLFVDNEGRHLRLEVATPTFEKEDLRETILYWTIFLFGALLLVIVIISIFAVRRALRPLYALLRWLDGYTPGERSATVPSGSSIVEFKALSEAAQSAVNRSEAMLAQQKQFLGNASHELQTPLAVIGNRVDYLVDHTSPTEEQLAELLRIKQSLRHSVRLNRTLLTLARIESGEVGQSDHIDVVPMIGELIESLDDVYSARELSVEVTGSEHLWVDINESMLRMVVVNMLKNAYVHAPEHSTIDIRIEGRSLTVSNRGAESLDADSVFDRFYTKSAREGSTGLGLAIVKSVCDHYGYEVNYNFDGGYHRFVVRF